VNRRILHRLKVGKEAYFIVSEKSAVKLESNYSKFIFQYNARFVVREHQPVLES